MNNKRATKRALLTSVTALVMCVVMLVGTTFAWFTDTASTGVNKIQAGNLDVALEMAVGKKDSGEVIWENAEGKTLQFKKATDAPANEQVLWEPGCTYELPQLRVVNNGNLALKYKVAISGITGDGKLCEVIDWYCNDDLIDATSMAVSEDTVLNANTAGDAFTLKGHMQETANNDYQGLSISGISVTVYATQAAVEYDSFNNTYDAGAEYAYVNNATELTEALNAGKNVLLNSTITLTEQLRIEKDVTINGNGNAIITAKPVQIAPTANVTIKNVSFTDPVNVSAAYGNKDVGSNIYAGSGAGRFTGKLVLDGCSFSGTRWDCVQAVVDDGAQVVINDCRFELNAAAPEGNKTRFIHIEAAQNSNADVKVTMTNNYFGASTYITEALIDIDYINIAGIDFGGNNVYIDTNADIYVCGPSMDRTISKADAYEKLGSKLVVADTQEDLNNAISSNTTATVKLTEKGTYTLPSLENKDVTIIGTKDTVINLTDVVKKANSVTFDGVTVNFGTNNYKGFQHTSPVVYKDCTINGFMTTYGDTVFESCTFNSGNDQYSINFYGGKNFTLTNCHFYGVNKNVYIYQETLDSDKNVTFTDCDFHMSATEDLKSAVMLNSAAYSFNGYKYNVVINNCTAEGARTEVAENVQGSTNYQGLYGLKHSPLVVEGTVTINGTTVYTH